mmetsp:Transcript_987/g.2002  ORF Transcript_987/g.2002 Transcript_987/m.2002 type:complete len:231 (-) Transcript_987:665-1357(-)
MSSRWKLAGAFVATLSDFSSPVPLPPFSSPLELIERIFAMVFSAGGRISGHATPASVLVPSTWCMRVILAITDIEYRRWSSSPPSRELISGGMPSSWPVSGAAVTRRWVVRRAFMSSGEPGSGSSLTSELDRWMIVARAWLPVWNMPVFTMAFIIFLPCLAWSIVSSDACTTTGFSFFSSISSTLRVSRALTVPFSSLANMERLARAMPHHCFVSVLSVSASFTNTSTAP